MYYILIGNVSWKWLGKDIRSTAATMDLPFNIYFSCSNSVAVCVLQ